MEKKTETFHLKGFFKFNREWMEELFDISDIILVMTSIPPVLKYALNTQDKIMINSCLCFLYKFMAIMPESIKQKFLEDLEKELGIKIEPNLKNEGLH